MELNFRRAGKTDENQVWEIIRQVIEAGDTYVFDSNSSKEEMVRYWFDADKHTYVCTSQGLIVATFIIKDNQPGLGSHVANASYMTHPLYRGNGIGKRMGEFSILEARALGYKAMQFNIVVKSNETAVRLWQKIGFRIIGEIPQAFNHRDLGLTNAYIMYQKL